MEQSGKNYKRIVIKIGSSILFPGGSRCDSGILSDIAKQVSVLIKEGREIVIVSSGAIALGMHIMGMESRPRELSRLQAAAALGQNALMDAYSRAFANHKINCAQVLLTWEDFCGRQRFLNAKQTLLTLLGMGLIVPVINENDTVSTDEIKFGDNDRLSALVATLVKADLLIILSDVDGFMDKEGRVIRVIDKITPQIKALACSTTKKTCVGGMVTKLEAVKIAIDAGIPCVIANGRSKDIISALISQPDDGRGTLFVSGKGLSAKKHWIAFGSKPKGRIIVDDGAKNALLNKKSLLSIGVAGIEGNFERAEIVSIVDKAGQEFARGKACLSGKQAEIVKGTHSDKEIIHCDNIVIL